MRDDKTGARRRPRGPQRAPQVTLTIDGREVTCDRGETIL